MPDIQFIAYQLQTAAEGNTNRQRYPGLTNQKKDIEFRCKIMADAIDEASDHQRIVHSATKLFVAPEFFFRGGTGGVYNIENVSYINETMDKYLALPKYKKWIFVLGTALAVMPSIKSHTATAEPSGGSNPEIVNIALVRKGGVKISVKYGVNDKNKLRPDDSLIVYKEYVSAIDFLGQHFGDTNAFYGNPGTAGKANVSGSEKTLRPTSGARPTNLVTNLDVPNIHGQKRVWQPSVKLRAFILSKYNKGKITDKERDRLFNMLVPYTISEESKTGLGGGTNFKMGGFSFVLEICLDHLQRRALSSVNQLVDIHVVSSCGMSPKYALVKVGGYHFLVDGIAHDAGCVSLLKRTSSGFDSINSLASIPMHNSSRWKRHLGSGTNLFQAGRGTIYIFPKDSIS